MKTPLTLARLKHHFGYHWWQYLLIIAACLLGLNFFFTVTGARPADDEQVELVVYGYADSDVLNAWMESVRVQEFPEQEMFIASLITPDDAGAQALFVRVGVGNEGELIVVPKEQFQNYAESGVFEPMGDSAAIAKACETYGIRTDKGRWKGPDDVERLYGIPVSELPLLDAIMFGGGTESFVCVHHNNANEKVTEQVLCCLLRDMHTMPETTQAPR